MNNNIPPTTKKEFFKFICLVKHYRDMWERHSHTLQPLDNLMPSKVKFKWEYFKQKIFYNIKEVVNWNNSLASPEINKQFEMHTYARNFQLGLVIII